jgi:hypothetical protein
VIVAQEAELKTPVERAAALAQIPIWRRGAGIWRHGPAVAFYVLLALIFTYPTVAHLSDAITGIVDQREFYWNLWWIYRSVVQLGANPFDGTYLFHPFGLPLYFHTLNPLSGFLSIPLQMCCGTAVAYNVLNMFWFAVAGVGAYALAFYLTRNRAAAFVAGLIYGFSPYMAFHLYVGQVASLTTGLMPLYLLALLKGVRERARYLVVAAIVLWMIGMSDWHYLSFTIAMTGLFWLYETWRLWRLRAALVVFGKLIAVGGMFLVLFSPIIVPMLLEFAKEPYASRPVEHSVLHSADLLAFVLPSILHPLWGDWARSIFDRLVPDTIVGGIATLGYTALILGGIGVARAGRRAGLFVLLFVAGVLLALGPYLQVGGVNTFNTNFPIPMPFLAFRELPFMEVNRFASRFVSLAMIGLAMLAALGVAGLWEGAGLVGRSARGRRLFLSAVTLLILFEFWPRPFLMQPVGAGTISPFYQALAKDPSDFAIFEIPNLKQESMLAQTFHHKRIVGGRISREKIHPWWEARFFAPLLQAKAPWKDIGADESPAAARAALACQNIRYVVFYKHPTLEARSKPPESEALQAGLFDGIAPAYDGDDLRAYGPLTESSREPFWTPDTRWNGPETSANGTTFRWLKDDAGSLMVYPCGQTDVTLHFNVFSFARARTVEVSLNGQPIGSVQLDQDQLKSVDLPLTLRPGENTIELRPSVPGIVPAAEGISQDVRRLSIHLSGVSILPR